MFVKVLICLFNKDNIVSDEVDLTIKVHNFSS